MHAPNQPAGFVGGGAVLKLRVVSFLLVVFAGWLPFAKQNKTKRGAGGSEPVAWALLPFGFLGAGGRLPKAQRVRFFNCAIHHQ